MGDHYRRHAAGGHEALQVRDAAFDPEHGAVEAASGQSLECPQRQLAFRKEDPAARADEKYQEDGRYLILLIHS
jgi:hypothetical protein